MAAPNLLKHPFITNASSSPTASLMQRIQHRLEKLSDPQDIDFILSKSSSHSTGSRRKRTGDSEGWDFEVQTIKPEHYGPDVTPTFKRENSFSSLRSASARSAGSVTSSRSMTKRRSSKTIRAALLSSSHDDYDTPGKTTLRSATSIEDKARPPSETELGLAIDSEEAASVNSDSAYNAPHLCVTRALASHASQPPSELFQAVLDPTLHILEDMAEEMRGDSEATRIITKGIIKEITRSLNALDKHTDGGLISAFISTIMGYAMEDDDEAEDEDS